MEKRLQEYLDYLEVERGLAENTLQSYRRDLNKFMEFLKKQHFNDWKQVARQQIISYLLELQTKGLASSTVSRNLAAIRSFFSYLNYENLLQGDPASDLDSPKQTKKLPKVISAEEVEKLVKPT